MDRGDFQNRPSWKTRVFGGEDLKFFIDSLELVIYVGVEYKLNMDKIWPNIPNTQYEYGDL